MIGSRISVAFQHVHEHIYHQRAEVIQTNDKASGVLPLVQVVGRAPG